MKKLASSQVDCLLAPLEQQIFDNLFQAGATKQLVVALSGGLDSKVLLHALVRLRSAERITDLSAIHINHSLQAAADSWQNQNQTDCDFYQVPLYVSRLNLNPAAGNIEAEARQGRYQVFQDLIQDNQWLVMAHHQDDQVETLLFRLLRGCGIAGAAAMPASRVLGKGRLIRPLLQVSQADILAYAKSQSLTWIDDPSNQDESYSRNFIRHQLIPRISNKWPSYGKTLSRFSQVAREQSELLQELAEEDLQTIGLANENLNISGLMDLSLARQKNLLHYWGTKKQNLPPSHNEIEQVIKQLPAALEGATIKVDFGDQLVRSYAGQLMRVFRREPDEKFTDANWPIFFKPLTLDNGVCLSVKAVNDLGLRLPKVGEQVSVKARSGGEKCLPDYRSKAASLKKIYQELAVPPWQRKWLPVIYYDNQLVAVPGVFVSKAFLSKKGEQAVRLLAHFF